MMTKTRKFPWGRLIFFATGNVHKFSEARRILADYDIATAMLRAKSLEIQNDDLEEIARISALDAAERSHLPIIVEDAGLFINALKGFPGPYSAYAYRTIGNEGILKLLEGHQERRAYFKSVIAFCEPSKLLKFLEGVVEGKIIKEKRGGGGFGFDPIFEASELPSKTFGEMLPEEKNKLSHRAKAITKFAEWYKKT